jgi:hypothetical protein
MNFQLIEAEREHLPIVVGRALAARNTAPARLAVDGLAVDDLAFLYEPNALGRAHDSTLARFT